MGNPDPKKTKPTQLIKSSAQSTASTDHYFKIRPNAQLKEIILEAENPKYFWVAARRGKPDFNIPHHGWHPTPQAVLAAKRETTERRITHAENDLVALRKKLVALDKLRLPQ